MNRIDEKLRKIDELKIIFSMLTYYYSYYKILITKYIIILTSSTEFS